MKFLNLRVYWIPAGGAIAKELCILRKAATVSSVESFHSDDELHSYIGLKWINGEQANELWKIWLEPVDVSLQHYFSCVKRSVEVRSACQKELRLLQPEFLCLDWYSAQAKKSSTERV